MSLDGGTRPRATPDVRDEAGLPHDRHRDDHGGERSDGAEIGDERRDRVDRVARRLDLRVVGSDQTVVGQGVIDHRHAAAVEFHLPEIQERRFHGDDRGGDVGLEDGIQSHRILVSERNGNNGPCIGDELPGQEWVKLVDLSGQQMQCPVGGLVPIRRRLHIIIAFKDGRPGQDTVGAGDIVQDDRARSGVGQDDMRPGDIGVSVGEEGVFVLRDDFQAALVCRDTVEGEGNADGGIVTLDSDRAGVQTQRQGGGGRQGQLEGARRARSEVALEVHRSGRKPGGARQI